MFVRASKSAAADALYNTLFGYPGEHKDLLRESILGPLLSHPDLVEGWGAPAFDR